MKQLWVSAQDIISAINFQPNLVFRNWDNYKVELDKVFGEADATIKAKDEDAKIILYAATVSLNYELFKLAYDDEEVTDYVGYGIESGLIILHKDVWELYNLFRLCFKDGKYNQTTTYSLLSAQAHLLFSLLQDSDVFENISGKKNGPLFADNVIGAVLVSPFLTSLAEPWAKIAKHVRIAITNEDMHKVADDSPSRLAKLITNINE